MRTVFKKSIFIVSAVIVIIFLIAVIFWLKEYQERERGLNSFVPQGAVSYTEFNLVDEGLNNYLKENRQAKKILEEFLFKNELAANIWQAEEKISNIGLVIFKRMKNEDEYYLEKAWLIRTQGDAARLEATSLNNYYYVVLNKNTAVLSLSESAVQEIKDFKKKSNWINNRKYNQAVHGFVRLSFLAQQYKINIFKNELLGKYIGLDKNKKIEWGVDINKDRDLLFKLKMDIGGNSKLIISENERNDRFFEIKDSIIINNFKFKNIFDIIKKELAIRDELSFEKFGKYIEDKYNIDLAGVYTFFDQPVSIVLRPKLKKINLLDINNFNNYYYALVWDIEDEKIEDALLVDLETFFQNYLAFKYPEKKLKILEDGSSGFELIANTDKFSWQDGQDEFNKLRIISGDIEIVYGQNNGKFILSNSKELAREVLEDSRTRGGIDGFDIKIKSNIIDNSFFGLEKDIFIKSKVIDNSLLIEGITIK